MRRLRSDAIIAQDPKVTDIPGDQRAIAGGIFVRVQDHRTAGIAFAFSAMSSSISSGQAA